MYCHVPFPLSLSMTFVLTSLLYHQIYAHTYCAYNPPTDDHVHAALSSFHHHANNSRVTPPFDSHSRLSLHYSIAPTTASASSIIIVY